MRIQTFMQAYFKTLYLQMTQNVYMHEGCSKLAHVENAIFAKNNLSPNFSEPQVYL